jgi:radical SAM superfamily enzyme YgiQ (UPF0313 family)
MKICICTTPIRPVPTTYPPFGSLAIIQALRKIGENVSFYNIDYFRYQQEQVKKYFAENQFDVVGISAVVSTAYTYTKFLANLIRSVSPATKIVIGGNLAASAEILLRKTEVDFCVAGDGEITIRNLVRIFSEKPLNYGRLRETKGLCFLDEEGRFEFTGFGLKPAANEIDWPDYEILEADGSLPYFITDQVDARFAGSTGSARIGDRVATVVMTKGCVARCTFCHRWEKGFRARPVDQIIGHIQYLQKRYNVRYVDVADENFGSDREIAWELASRLGQMNIVWTCAGVRTRTVNKESLLHWKANGCVSVIYGIESGSPTMLEVMEKNATLEENINALKWTYEAGLGTIVQLVLAMPGETDKTIYETIDFLKKVSAYQLFWDKHAPSEVISINYAQALPGTPLYEWAREHGYIGKTIDEEEKYLMRISDTDAYSEDHFINYTGLPMLKVLTWRPLILAELDAYYFRDKGVTAMSLWHIMKYYFGLLLNRVMHRIGIHPTHSRNVLSNDMAESQGKVTTASGKKSYDHVKDSGYFNIHSNLKFAPLLLNAVTRAMFYPLLAIAVAFWRGGSPLRALRLIGEHLYWSLTKPFRPPLNLPNRSLRKVVAITKLKGKPGADKMTPLRLGR